MDETEYIKSLIAKEIINELLKITKTKINIIDIWTVKEKILNKLTYPFNYRFKF